MTNELGKSDSPIVPTKPPNKAASVVAEEGEGRGLAKGNARQTPAVRTQRRVAASCGLERVRKAAKRDKDTRFTALLHHITIDRLRTCFFGLKRKAAAGVDGVTWKAYRDNLEENLRDLHGRLHQGSYRASPSRRVLIDKPDGGHRPLGIATLEEKLLQSALTEVLNAIYEVDFLGFSYGFRPERGPHQALDALGYTISRRKVNWVLDTDIQGFFDSISHEWLMRFLQHRIADKRVLRLIQKWLTVGILEDGQTRPSTEGTPQGATLSPLLANVYLHYALDLWSNQWRGRHARGEMIVVRYADDVVFGFQYYADAKRFREALRSRLMRFDLTLHPRKTRLIRFGRFASRDSHRRGQGKPDTFDFLGLTHICSVGSNGSFKLARLTSRKRLARKLKEVAVSLSKRRHLSLPEQGRWLGSVVRGYFAYHAVPDNFQTLVAFHREVSRHWLRALRRRSQRDRFSWKRLRGLVARWLPRPRILHPRPEQRFLANTRGRSPVR